MRDFVAQRSNVLLCSTIIETGIDVPTANTIVMSRADKFGLAQLHQLRGRVGRSHHQAYAYLMVPDLEGPDQAGRAAAGRHSGDGRTRQRLLFGHARPGDSWCR
jgi:transcription-repair coupling factor (superfamily II helicase)